MAQKKEAELPESDSSASDSSGPSTPPFAAMDLDMPKSLKAARKGQPDFLMAPEDIQGWKEPHTFHTLDLAERFREPSADEFDHPELQKLVAPHIESFNMLWSDDPTVDALKPKASTHKSEAKLAEGEGLLAKAIRKIPSRVIYDGKGASEEQWENGQAARMGNRLEIWCESITMGRPQVVERARDAKERRIFPAEVSNRSISDSAPQLTSAKQCRERLVTYRAPLNARIVWSVNGGPAVAEMRSLGLAPVMVRSSRCNLRDHTSKELVKRGEEQNEMGGYFIINGNERLIRFLIVPKANHVTAIDRSSFERRGPSYSRKACTIRCVPKEDLASVTNTVHYLENGGVTLRFSWRKQEYMVPIVLVLKALTDVSDKEIFTSLAQGDFDNTFITDRIELLLRSFKSYNLHNGSQCLQYLGDKFRVVMGAPEDFDNYQVGAAFIDQIVLIHLGSPREKSRMLVHMIRKLYSLIAKDSCTDNEDSPQHQEILLPGFLYGQIVKERIDEFLQAARIQIAREVRLANNPRQTGPRSKTVVDFFDSRSVSKTLTKVRSDVGARLNAFLATGNLVSQSGLDLKQATGFTIVAEKLNFYRYLSHFRCVHRGAFFAELKTTSVRKLLPEAWGFLCPVHTPDGSPCGLLNHFSHTCQLTTRVSDTTPVPGLLAGLGMLPAMSPQVNALQHVVVQLDGAIIGYATPAMAKHMAMALRIWKTEGQRNVPLDLEIGLVPLSRGGQFPGLYLFSNRARMMRPVTFLHNGKIDLVGPFEQVYLDIACQPEEVEAGVTTHLELAPTSVLSVLANLTPFSDFNQSPRNMYQCQMGKQTMGTPSTNINHRTDNKLYRIQSPQTPVVRPFLHSKYSFDDYPNGTNAIVAVISYTGYDMEDAMILNKSSHERGFGYGSVYKSAIVDLRDLQGSTRGPPTIHFGFGPDVKLDHPYRSKLDEDGMPFIGDRIKEGEPYCAYWDETTGRTQYKKMKGDDLAYVDTVRVLGTDAGDGAAQKIQITLRIPRSPVIGDKFSSRHGQKGVCSQKWPAVDMPFSESGMQPDVIINPHAFPSRMTIGMLIESMAGKAGAMHGISQDSTPFT